MRTTTLFTCLFLGWTTLFSQSSLGLELENIPDHEIQADQSSEWYNYARLIGDISSSAPYYRNFLFPDTTVRVVGSSGYFNVWTHSMGQTFDPVSWNWELAPNTMLDENTIYTLDSVALPYRYRRPQTDFPDTLIMQVYKHDKHTFGTFNSSGQSYASVDYDYVNRIGGNADTTIVYLLNNEDSITTGQGILEFPIGFTIGGNEVVSVTYTYLPGNPYNENDTIDFYDVDPVNDINGFLVYDFYDEDKTTEEGVYNQGMLVTPDVRYNESTNGWNGSYISGYAYSNGFYQNDVFFKISSVNTSVAENSFSETAIIQGENHLNTGMNLILTNYLTYRIIDIQGRIITTKTGSQFNTKNLNSGVYFIQSEINQQLITQKFIVR